VSWTRRLRERRLLMPSTVSVRAFRAADLPGAEAANDAVGWGQRRVLFEFYGARDDTALFVAEVDGAIVGTGGATVFPGAPPTGWVHGIVVRPEHQRAGLGARLTEAAVAWLRARSVGAILLLATDAGRPVYERLGFVAGERYGAYAWPTTGAPRAATIGLLEPGQLAAVCELDRVATGEDRSRFLATLADGGWVATCGDEVVGFHVPCPWGGGPTIARDPAVGLALVGRAAGDPRRPSRTLGLPEANVQAVRHLTSLGIRAERHVTRMWLGTPPRWRPDMIFGVFNFGVA
jgi:GNAT superfamily N-acetyltransferase